MFASIRDRQFRRTYTPNGFTLANERRGVYGRIICPGCGEIFETTESDGLTERIELEDYVDRCWRVHLRCPRFGHRFSVLAAESR